MQQQTIIFLSLISYLLVYFFLRTALAVAWSRSDSRQAAQLTRAILKRMIQQYQDGDRSLKPDVVIFTVVIKACIHTTGKSPHKRAALNIALKAMKALQEKTAEFGPPNHASFATLMKVINHLAETDKERFELLDSTFQQCTESGNLSKEAVDQMTREKNWELFRHLIRNTDGLKPEWSRKVPPKYKPHSVLWAARSAAHLESSDQGRPEKSGVLPL
jgi:hypothetical protein